MEKCHFLKVSLIVAINITVTLELLCNSDFFQTEHIRNDLFCRGSASNTACTSATSTASSDMVVEGGSKDGLIDDEDSLAGFDDSPLLFPE